jgi:large subunit ribosomal protein L15
MRVPKRGFNNPFRADYAEVNLWRLAKAIEAGRLDASQPLTAETLKAAGVIRREKDGVRLLGHGELTTAINITVHSASPSAVEAVQAAGGTVTQTRKPKPEAAAEAQ